MLRNSFAAELNRIQKKFHAIISLLTKGCHSPFVSLSVLFNIHSHATAYTIWQYLFPHNTPCGT